MFVAQDQIRPLAKFVPSGWASLESNLDLLQALRTSHRGLAASATKFAGARSIVPRDSLAGQRNFPFLGRPPILLQEGAKDPYGSLHSPSVACNHFASIRFAHWWTGAWVEAQEKLSLKHSKIVVNRVENAWNGYMALYDSYMAHWMIDPLFCQCTSSSRWPCLSPALSGSLRLQGWLPKTKPACMCRVRCCLNCGIHAASLANHGKSIVRRYRCCVQRGKKIVGIDD